LSLIDHQEKNSIETPKAAYDEIWPVQAVETESY
jgi:hypothetical protein